MPYVTEISLFAAAFIAAYVFGQGIRKALAEKLRPMSKNRRRITLGALGARLRFWRNDPPG